MPVQRKSNTDQRRAQLHEAARQVVRVIGQELMEDAQADCPVDEGELRDSHELRIESETRTAVVVTAQHAVPVHFGTNNRPGNPWLLRAVERMRAQLARRAAQLVKEHLR